MSVHHTLSAPLLPVLRRLLLVALLLAGPVHAQITPVKPEASANPAAPANPAAAANPGRPRIGLVLGGGGAKGFAHVGVIEELERRHIPVDVIAGTSMGAVVGSIYATGRDAGEVSAVAHGIDWVAVFDDKIKRSELSFRRKLEDRSILLGARVGFENGKPMLPQGVLGGQRLYATVEELLAPWLATDNFDQLPIPYRAVATNIVTGQPVVLGSGSLSTAVFASMSIPAAFPPVEREGLLLVDGGISDNVPVNVARNMGVDLVIVVDVGDPPLPASRITNALSVFTQMQLLLGYDAIRRQLDSLSGRDVLIKPDISGLSATGFDKLDLGIERGRAAAVAVADRLAPLALNDRDWAAYLAQREARRHPAPIRIDSVRIANTSGLPDAEVAALVTTRPGDILDPIALRREVGEIYALDEFDRVQYDISGAPGNHVLTIDARGNPSSTKYFRFGMTIGSDFGTGSDFELGIGYTDRNFLGTGAEWRGFGRIGSDVLFDVSLYKQFGKLFVEPIAYFQNYSAQLIQSGSTATVDRLSVVRGGAGLDGGVVFGNWGELRVGTRLGGVNPLEGSADVGVPHGWNRDVDWHVGVSFDTLDSVTFPTRGALGTVQFTNHVTALGGQFSRDELEVRAFMPFSFGATTLVLGGRLGTSAHSINDFIGDFQLGGFLSLSGLPRNSLIGRNLVLGNAVVFHRLSKAAPILDLPIYFGGSLEAGNVYDRLSDFAFDALRVAGSAFVAADTPVGPVWLAIGHSSNDRTSIYLVLGRVF